MPIYIDWFINSGVVCIYKNSIHYIFQENRLLHEIFVQHLTYYGAMTSNFMSLTALAVSYTHLDTIIFDTPCISQTPRYWPTFSNQCRAINVFCGGVKLYNLFSSLSAISRRRFSNWYRLKRNRSLNSTSVRKVKSFLIVNALPTVVENSVIHLYKFRLCNRIRLHI